MKDTLLLSPAQNAQNVSLTNNNMTQIIVALIQLFPILAYHGSPSEGKGFQSCQGTLYL